MITCETKAERQRLVSGKCTRWAITAWDGMIDRAVVSALAGHCQNRLKPGLPYEERRYTNMDCARPKTRDPDTWLFHRGEGNTNILSFQVKSLQGFDAQAFRRLLHAAVVLDADGTAKPPPPKQRQEWPMPEALAKALKKNKTAAAGFAAMSVSSQREYKVWISTAKQPETIAKRLDETLRAVLAGRKWAQRKEA